MLSWFKSKKPAKPPKSAEAVKKPAAPQSREEIMAGAMKNAQSAREAIGAENLEKLSALIRQKQAEQEVSPAAQAKKIIAQMDKDKVGDFLKFMVQDGQTKH